MLCDELSITDMTPLPYMENLQRVIIDNCNMKSLEYIKNLTNLELLDILNNKIEDLSVLSSMNKLSSLNFSFNKVRDASVLDEVEVEGFDCEGFRNIIEDTISDPENVSVPIIIQQACDENSLLYSDQITLRGCEWNEYGKSINVLYKDASIQVENGVIMGTTYNVSCQLKEIKITSVPTKTAYIEGEDFDPTGISVYALYGKEGFKYINNYTIIDGDDLQSDKKYVTISYTENGVTKTVRQNIRVKPKTLTGIEITKVPTKTTYIEGENFETTGLEVVAVYNNGKKIPVTNYVVIDGENLTKEKTSVTINYTEEEKIKTVTQNITVNPKTLIGIEITKLPTKTTYIEGENFESTGLEITATYNNEQQIPVTNYVVTDGENLTKEKTNVTISYTEGEITKTITQSIIVSEKRIDVKDYILKDNLISNVQISTTISDFRKTIEGYNKLVIYDKEGNEITDNDAIIATGMEVSINENIRYKIAVKSDISMDGKLSAMDLSQLKANIVMLMDLEAVQLEAADLNNDSKISASDMSILKIKLVS